MTTCPKDCWGVRLAGAKLLGSTSETTGQATSEQLYFPYGSQRTTDEVVAEYRFTGQRWEEAIGLYDYKARWYDPELGRFVQPDTIVPEPGNPQALNRYSYVLNNPVRYTDPTGHVTEKEEESAADILRELLTYNVYVYRDWGWLSMQMLEPGQAPQPVWHQGEWELTELYNLMVAVQRTAQHLGGREAFVGKLKEVTFRDYGEGRTLAYRITQLLGWEPGEELPDFWGLHLGGGRIALFNNWQVNAFQTPVHEMAHAWDSMTGGQLRRGLKRAVGNEAGPTEYAQTSSAEDWAESLTVYVHPARADPMYGFGRKHRDYVTLIVNGQ